MLFDSILSDHKQLSQPQICARGFNYVSMRHTYSDYE